MKSLNYSECMEVSGGIQTVIISQQRKPQDGGVYMAPYGNNGSTSGGVGGGSAVVANLTKASVGAVSLMTALVTDNPVRVVTASFTVGYSVANALGAESLGHKIGGMVYNVLH